MLQSHLIEIRRKLLRRTQIELIVNVYRYPIHELILNQALNYCWIFYLRLLSDLKVIDFLVLMSMTSRLEGGLKSKIQ